MTATGTYASNCYGYTMALHTNHEGVQFMYLITHKKSKSTPSNKGKLVGQKPPLKLKEIWAIRIRLQLANRHRDLAMFNLAIDSKLRACDLIKIRVRDVSRGGRIASCAIVMQQKTQRTVQSEITEQTRVAISIWIESCGLLYEDFLFPSRIRKSPHI